MPIKVELLPHDRHWAELAVTESGIIRSALAENLITVHHIGSTAIPSIEAKPIVDLIPVVGSLERLDVQRPDLEALGYGWHGPLGLPGRRNCTKSDPKSGRRRIQLHIYQDGSPEITRHVAFRNYLRNHPGLAREYEAEKFRCQVLHPDNSHSYSDCKDAWIKRIEAEALRLVAK